MYSRNLFLVGIESYITVYNESLEADSSLEAFYFKKLNLNIKSLIKISTSDSSMLASSWFRGHA